MQRLIPFGNPLKNKKLVGTGKLIAFAALFFALGAGSMWWIAFRAAQNTAVRNQEDRKTPIQGVINADNPNLKGADFSTFWDVWATIQERYVGRKDLDYQKMVYGAIQGMVDSLGDQYSVFFPPQENKDFQEEVSGQFQGIGIEIGMKDNVPTVVSPLEGTPAQRAGLMAGDKILKINASSTQNMSLDEAIRIIRGPKGTQVTLGILRKGWDAPRDIAVMRDVISVPSAKYETDGSDVAVIHLYNFYAPSGFEFRKAALQALLSGRKRIVLDLRNNPGGYFDAAVDVAGWFVPANTAVVKEDDGNGPYLCETCVARGLGLLKDDKVVVLVNGGSASASEILAGALRDDLGVQLVGEQTFGKGSVQDVYPVDANASLKLTIAKWLTPNGTNIGSVGLKPDVEVKESASSTDDLQLQRALELVRSL